MPFGCYQLKLEAVIALAIIATEAVIPISLLITSYNLAEHYFAVRSSFTNLAIGLADWGTTVPDY